MSLAIAFSRLCVSNAIKNIQRIPQQPFHLTPVALAEPMKKRKRLDPQIIKARLDRRKKKLEKAIRRLQKNARQLKPIDEVEIPKVLSKPEDRAARMRSKVQLTDEQVESRELLHKEWARYQRQQKSELYNICQRLIQSQDKALSELRCESEELYQAAIQPSDLIYPITVKGPVFTPPIQNYDSPAEMVTLKMLAGSGSSVVIRDALRYR